MSRKFQTPVGAPRGGPPSSPPSAEAEGAPLHDDVLALREALAGVRPLEVDTVPLRPPPPPPIPQQARRDEQEVLREMVLQDPGAGELEMGDELMFRRDGVQHALLRKLRRGQFAVQAHLDLHGLTSAEARLRLAGFLQQCVGTGLRCVRIVHGKGNSSPGKLPVLKPRVAHWLAQRDEVLAYASARPVDGGTGAVYVLLRAPR
ncbi:MAG: Smr/MutS family protein [Gammaproteobacteria bacterium]|nr:Smr/MutS family protein [Gammaproteobacteria bacterium]